MRSSLEPGEDLGTAQEIRGILVSHERIYEHILAHKRAGGIVISLIAGTSDAGVTGIVEVAKVVDAEGVETIALVVGVIEASTKSPVVPLGVFATAIKQAINRIGPATTRLSLWQIFSGHTLLNLYLPSTLHNSPYLEQPHRHNNREQPTILITANLPNASFMANQD